jgi:CheY-like chemotaxis protein
MSIEMSNIKPHVLFVEDEVLVSALMSDVLEERGFSVHAVENGEAALEYLQSGAQVDVLFTDINMPGEIDGARRSPVI